jgi:hypothetical protein
MRTITISVAIVAGLAATAAAEPAQVVGHLVDTNGRELESATVQIGGETAITNAHGIYRIVLPDRGSYTITFDYADGHSEQQISVDGPIATVDARLAVDSEATIVIHDPRRAVTAPESTSDPLREKAPPYSKAAIEHDRWAKAWLLLDVDETGTVQRLKLLNDPGYDLAPIAIAEGFKQHFSPARDAAGQPTTAITLHAVEWPSYWWLVNTAGLTTHIPAHTTYMQCRGRGPMMMDSMDQTYRDCTGPDYKKATTERWIPNPGR